MVCADQREASAGMVKWSDLLPTSRSMAILAFAPQLPAMRVFLGVAGSTCTGGSAKVVAVMMTSGAADFSVAASQREIGHSMIKVSTVKAHQRRSAAFMLDVARRTSAMRGQEFTVKATTRSDIATNPGMTSSAFVDLRLFPERRVASIAFRLKPRMRAAQLPRGDQSLHNALRH